MCVAIELFNIVHHDFQQICSYNDSPFFSVNGVTLLRVDLLFYGSGRKIFKKFEEYYSSGKRDMIHTHWNCSGILDFVELGTAICTE